MEREILEAAVKKYEERGDKVQLNKVLERLRKLDKQEQEKAEVEALLEPASEPVKHVPTTETVKTKPKRKKK